MEVNSKLSRAPAEVLSDSRVSRASDIYSFGMMMLELYTCKPLFPGMGHPQARHATGLSVLVG